MNFIFNFYCNFIHEVFQPHPKLKCFLPVDPGGGEGDDPEQHQQGQSVHPAADVRQKVHGCKGKRIDKHI